MHIYTSTIKYTTSPREVITNPQDFHAHPAVLQDSWAELKAQRGQPITPDRMERLHPAYGILPARPTLLLPSPYDALPINSDIRREHEENFVREAVVARGHTPRSFTRKRWGHPFGGGDAA